MRRLAVLAAVAVLGGAAPGRLPHNGLIAFATTEDVAPQVFVSRYGGSEKVLVGGRVTAAAASPDGTRIAVVGDGSGLVVVNAAGGHRISFGEASQPSWSPDGRRLVFVTTNGIAVADAQTGSTHRLGVFGDGPVWSPDGSRIAFVDSTETVDVVGASGSNVTPVATAAFVDLETPPVSWSADGKWLAFDAVDTQSTVEANVVRADGSDRVWLGDGTATSWSPRSDELAFAGSQGLEVVGTDGSVKQTFDVDGSPVWSPTGQAIAAGSPDVPLTIVRPASGAITKLAEHGVPAWSPDGTHVLALSGSVLRRFALDGSSTIVSKDADAPILWAKTGHLAYGLLPTQRSVIDVVRPGHGVSRALIRSAPSASQPPSYESLAWSPNGRLLAFVRDDNRASDVEVVSIKGGTPRLVARFANAPSWSPDSRRLAVATSQGIATVDLRTLRLHRLTHSSADADPEWSPDGRRIAFGSDTDLDVIAATGGAVRRLAADVSSTASWSPDGTRLTFSTGDAYYPTAIDTVGADGGAVRHLVSEPAAGDTGDVVSTPSWSPDGRWILFVDEDYLCGSKCSNLYLDVVRPDGTGKHRLGSYLEDASWSPDGSSLVGVDPNDGVLVRQELTRSRSFPVAPTGSSASWQPRP